MKGSRPGPKAKPFWSHVKKTAGCWEWTGTLFTNGYGRATVRRASVGAHRVSYEIAYGPIPAGLVVRHRCDNKRCVRPEHLEVGTAAENARDRVDRGRSLAGDANPNSILSSSDVLAIRQLYAAGGVTQKQLALAFGVVEGNVWNILHGRSWRFA